MATTVSIVVDVTSPGGGEFAFASVSFALSGPDTEGTETIPASTVSVDLDAAGQATVALWPPDLGVNGRFYTVTAYARASGETAVRAYNLGTIQPLSTGGASQNLSTLIEAGGGISGGYVYQVVTQSDYATFQSLLSQGLSVELPKWDGGGDVVPFALAEAGVVLSGYNQTYDFPITGGYPAVTHREYGNSPPAKLTVSDDIYAMATDEIGRVILGYDDAIKSVVGAGLHTATVQSERIALTTSVYSGAFPFFAAYGQSNSTDFGGAPVINGTQPYSNVMFKQGTFPGTTEGVADAITDTTGFDPMIEQDRESPVSSIANTQRELALKRRGEATSAQAWLGVSMGRNGASIAQLSKGGAFYTRLIGAVTAANTIDPNYRIVAMPYIQGEADQEGATTKADWKAAAITLQSDFETDAQAANGQTTPIPMIFAQTNRTTQTKSDIPMAQLELAQAGDERFYLACPMYHVPFLADGVHPNNVGKNLLGAYMARALDDLMQGVRPRWLNPKQAWVQGADLVVKFDAPHAPLSFDTRTLPKTKDFGFVVTDLAGDIVIDSIWCEGDTVRMTLGKTPTNDVTVRYALDNVAPGLNLSAGGGASGNLRDSDTETCYIDGVKYTLHNWSPHFEMTATRLGA